MKTGPLTLAATLAACLVGVSAQALTVLVDEDFESYADSAALKSVWTVGGTDNGELVDETYEEFITLDDLEPQPIGARAFPSGGQGVEHRGQGILEIDVAALNGGSPIAPSSSQSIVLEADIFDVGQLGNKRLSVGLRSNAPANLIELGQWNSEPIGYAHRAILFPSTEEDPNPNWAFFELPIELDRDDDDDDIVTVADIGEVWSTYRVTITEDTLTYEIDLFRDGLINDGTETPGVDASITYNIATDTNGYDSLRLGGPSGVSSAGNNFYGGSIFDNIKLSLVDEDTGIFGDFEPDGDVDIIDFGVFADAFGSMTGDAEYNAAADSEPDGDVDIIDFGLFADNFGTGVAATAVPEPTGAALLAGLMGLGLSARVRR